MAQFRVEFVIDQSTGKYLAEMYHPDNPSELIVRTEALYPSQAAAVLGDASRTVEYWVRAYGRGELAGLQEKPRSGRPPRLTA